MLPVSLSTEPHHGNYTATAQPQQQSNLLSASSVTVQDLASAASVVIEGAGDQLHNGAGGPINMTPSGFLPTADTATAATISNGGADCLRRARSSLTIEIDGAAACESSIAACTSDVVAITAHVRDMRTTLKATEEEAAAAEEHMTEVAAYVSDLQGCMTMQKRAADEAFARALCLFLKILGKQNAGTNHDEGSGLYGYMSQHLT